SATVVMDSPKVVTALWKTQYELVILSSNLATTGQGWYDKGVTATIDIPPVSEYTNQTRHVFTSWSGDISARAPRTSIVMDSPKRVEAEWKTQYFLKVVSFYGNPRGEGWHDRGEQATIQVSTPEDHGNMTRHMFTGWTGDIVAEEDRLEVTVTAPKQVEANWKTQYYLEVDSAFGQPDGEGWYDRGTSTSFKVLTPVDWGNQTRHVFVKWTGDVESDTPEGSILISSPRTVSANWKTQYLISLIFTDSSEQEEFEPSSAELIDEAGRRILLRDYEEVWFDPDSYSISEVSWMNVDVRDPEASTFTVSRPGEIRFSTETYSLTLIVRDLLSLPIQDAKVTTRFAGGTSTVARTDSDGIAKYSLIPLGGYSADVEFLGLRSQQIGDASLNPEVTVTMSLSIPTVILLAAVAGSALGAVLLVRRRSSRWPRGVRLSRTGRSI
ncbi:MAG: carboxypeptidase-like regulatory domain-containing protein, partial [Nitrososphaerales archaeon]